MTLRLLDLSILIDAINRNLDSSFHKAARHLNQLMLKMHLIAVRNQQRHTLKTLSDARLNDMGITRNQAEVEASKYFWE